MAENCSASLISMYMYIRARCARAHRLPDGPRAWFQARDIIGKMASNRGEESGACSVFCGPVLGKVQAFC